METKGLDNKISNIVGVKISQLVIDQLSLRSTMNSQDSRSNSTLGTNSNLLYLANKSAWVRLVSSVNVNDDRYLRQLSTIAGIPLNFAQSLAKNFVLFGGTSAYVRNNSYNLRSGVSFSDPNKTVGGAYGMLGKSEIEKYGYKPMPGITSVNIETQGRLGSIRAAVINFKCWDKQQLDIIDTLYFKLGFTMFLEWGHTFFYTSDEPNTLKKTEDYSIVDAFRTITIGNSLGFIPDFPTKEEILSQVSETNRKTAGNYDGMLGIVTNFNFVYNQDGGYDCTLRLMSLGMLGESIKINNPATLPKLLKEEILLLDKTLKYINKPPEGNTTEENAADFLIKDAKPGDLLQYVAVNIVRTYNANNVKYKTYAELAQTPQGKAVLETIAFSNSNDISNTAKKDFRAILQGVTGFQNSPVFAPSNFVPNIVRVSDPKTGATPLSYYQLLNDEFYNLDYIPSTVEGYLIGKKGIVISSKFKYSNITVNLGYLKDRYTQNLRDKNDLNVRTSFQTDRELIDAGIAGVTATTSLAEDDLFLSRSNLTQTSTTNDSVSTYSAGSSTTAGKRFAITYKSPVYSSSMTNDSYYFSLSIESSIKNQDGKIIGIASNKQILNTLRSIFTFNELSDLTFKNESSPFFKLQNINVQSTLSTEIFNKLNPNTDFYNFSLKGQYKIPEKIEVDTASADAAVGTTTRVKEQVDGYLNVYIDFNDTALISNIQSENNQAKLATKSEEDAKLAAQNQLEAQKKEIERKEQEALINQIQQSLSFQSALELSLRTIQVHSLNKAIYKTGKPDANIGNKVFVLEMTKDDEFLRQIFSNGIFTPYINNFKNNFSSTNLPENILELKSDQLLEVYTKYGFATSLLSNKASKNQIVDSYVRYENLLTSFVIPYRISQELVAGVQTNHPVYIPFGLLLMLLNHICTIYDSRIGSASQKPLVYIDYNPELNFFLTNLQQLSVDPFKVLIPFEGSDKDYQALFYDEVLTSNKQAINAYKNDKQGIPLFKPNSQDLISFKIQQYCPIKYNKLDSNAYRGQLMNILLSIDYLTDLVKQYSKRDGTNNVYLKPFLEDILTTINKSLGNFNSFRLSYNDSANTFQIVDDQLVPTLNQELMVNPNANQNDITNRTEIPLVGKTSIAKSIETKTEISSKLGSLLAISANPVMTDKSTLSTNADALGFMNTAFYDRYVNNRLAIGQNNPNSQRDSRIIEAIQFNSTITDFYSSVNPSDADVSQVISYYIERMSKVKNEQTASIASNMVPIGINFTTDGIGGLNMMQAFTVSDELLPYAYTAKYRKGYINNYNKYVGFVIVGLNHTIEANQWNTSVRTMMIPLKDKTAFTAPKIDQLPVNEQEFSVSEVNVTGFTNFDASDNELSQKARADIDAYLGRNVTDQEFNALIAIANAESTANEEEIANVIAVVLNRAKNSASGIIGVLKAPGQFEPVTGNKDNPGSKEKYLRGPGPNSETNIYNAIIKNLLKIKVKYNNFTSANKDAYSGSLDFYNNAISKGWKQIGGTLFGND